MQSFKEAHAIFRSYHAPRTALVGAVRRLRPYTLDHDSAEEMRELAQTNKLLLHLPQAEQTRIARERRAANEAQRRRAASWARRQLHGDREQGAVHRHAAEYQQLVERTRRDVNLTMPDALDRVDANGMIQLAAYRLQLSQVLTNAPPDRLLAMYEAAITRRDAAALVEAEIIEAMVTAPGRPLATTEAERPIAQQLRERVDGIQELRLPPVTELPDFEGLVAQVIEVEGLADALGIKPVAADDVGAEAAYAAEEEAMLEAGERPAAEDQAAYAEMARAMR